MALVKFFKSLASLPGTLVADAIYLVKTGAGFTLYATDTAGVAVALNTAAGGADPWTYVKLAADVSNNTTAAVATLLKFTPLVSSTYIVEGRFIVQSSAITTGIRPGINWPSVTQITAGAALVNVANSATTLVSKIHGNIVNATNAASTTTAVANENTYADAYATFVTSAAITGEFAITLASEVAASNVIMKAGSWIRYRTI